MRVACVIPRFNPCSYVRPRENFHRFIDALQRQMNIADVFVVEALFPGQVSDGWWTPIAATENNFLWQKERLVNLGIEQLPTEYDAIAWIDADLIFRNRHWYEQTCQMLHDYPVLQLFETVTYLGPDGETPHRHGCGSASAGEKLVFRAPGGAIAVRRDIIPNGIYDRDVLGGGDQIFMGACLGTHQTFWRKRHPPWRDAIQQWCESFGTHSVGVVPGNVKHLYHGSREGRQYTSRHQILATHAYDPTTDIRVGDNGLLEWASDKPDLHSAVRGYFTDRQEDH